MDVNQAQLIAYIVVVCTSILASLFLLIYYRNTIMHTHYKDEIKLMTYNYVKAEDFKKEGLSNIT